MIAPNRELANTLFLTIFDTFTIYMAYNNNSIDIKAEDSRL